AQNPEFFKERSIKLRRVMDLYQEMLEASHCTSLADLAVNGNDLIEQLGLKPGREIGTILERLLDAVIEDPGLNIREKLLEKAKQIQSHF
ncbi:MAG: polynucleotide adenylyltransferase, partial [Clostridia bacterium]|nr:polynucleotide adenylyltransferase [Clostridia bacterium]